MTRRLILIAVDRATGEVMEAGKPSGLQIVKKVPVAYMIWAPFSGPAQFTTDPSAPVKTAARADYTCTPLAAIPDLPVDLTKAEVKMPHVWCVANKVFSALFDSEKSADAFIAGHTTAVGFTKTRVDVFTAQMKGA